MTIVVVIVDVMRLRAGTVIGSLSRLIDDPRAALPREVPPYPLDGDKKALLEVDQEVDMDKRPKQPGRPAFQRPFSKVEDGGIPTDHRRITAILEFET